METRGFHRGSTHMNRKPMLLSALLIGMTACLASGVHAQSLDVTLSESTATVTQGTAVVDFYATIVNAGASTIYLNGDSPTTGSSLLSVDDSPFDNNAPLSLAAGASTGPIELFAVDILSPTIPTGTYSGNDFSILGGYTGSAVSDLADALFSVTVTSATSTTSAPEIDPASSLGALTLLLGSLLVLRGRRVVEISR